MLAFQLQIFPYSVKVSDYKEDRKLYIKGNRRTTFSENSKRQRLPKGLVRTGKVWINK